MLRERGTRLEASGLILRDAARCAALRMRKSVIQEASEFAAPARMLEFAQRLRFDLTDAFAGDRELLADFFQRVVSVHADAKAHAQHTLLARGERGEHARRGLAQVRLDRRVD